MQSFFVQKKTVIIEAAVLILFLGGMYYLYTIFSVSDTTVQPSANEQLLGQNFVLFLKAVNEDRISFNDNSFANSKLFSQLKDYSETIGQNDTRGRVDPFVPYASTRPLR
jgi:hypothetical protein